MTQMKEDESVSGFFMRIVWLTNQINVNGVSITLSKIKYTNLGKVTLLDVMSGVILPKALLDLGSAQYYIFRCIKR